MRRAAGLEEKTEQPPPRDELALIELNLLADPGLLDGRGAGDGIRTLTNDQRRALRREQLNAKAQDARKTLNKIIAGEEDEDDHASEPSAIKAMLRSDDEDEDDGWVTDEELVDIEVGEVYEL